MKAIIIEDEKRAQVALNLLLEEYCPQIEVVAICDNLAEGIKAIRKHQPKVVFLDIEMPGRSGLELLDFFNDDEINFGIIFTTAYNEYAIQAFKLSAVDYLLKPIHPQQLEDSVIRLEKLQNKTENYKLLKDNLDAESSNRIAISIGNTLVFVETSKIIFIKAEGSYSELNCENNIKYLVSKNLKSFEKTLCESLNFMRIHKSYIVNLNLVVGYNKSEGGFLILENGINLPVSADKIKTILDKIN